MRSLLFFLLTNLCVFCSPQGPITLKIHNYCKLVPNSHREFIIFNRVNILTVVIKNQDHADVFNVNVINNLPPQLEYISSNPLSTFYIKTRVLKWHLEKIKAGEEIRLTITLRATKIGNFTNKVTLFTKEYKATDEIVLHVVEGGVRIHLSTYDTTDPVAVGKKTTYMITLRNESGITTMTGIQFENILPEEMEFLTASGGAYEYDAKKHCVKFVTFSVLKLGEEIHLAIVCRAIKSGSAKNTIKVRYEQIDKEIIDEEGTSIYR